MARSRYSRLNKIDGKEYETFSLDQINKYNNDTFKGVKVRKYTVQLGDRLDHLAAQHLNDDKYYWAIALVSGLTNPFLSPGQKILIPLDIQEVLDRL